MADDFTKTYDTANPGGAVSNREELSDVLTIFAPEETPILSSLNKQKAASTYPEWTVDKLSAVSTAGIDEGADVTEFTDKFADRARLGNYIQKFRRDYKVSDLQEAVDSVGPAKVAQAEAKAVREIKRDIEATLLSGNEMQVEAGGATPYLLRGLGKWIQNGAQATNPVPANYRTPTGSIDATAENITETEFNALITSIYRVNGMTNSLMCVADSGLRRTISDYARIGDSSTTIRSVNYNGSSSDIKVSVDLYQSDHGIVSIVNMNPDCADATQTGAAYAAGFVLNTEYLGVHELIPMGSKRLPNLGGGERGFVDCALTLGCYHPAAHGKLSHT